MNYNITEEQLKDLMHRSWLKAKKFYKGQTDEYFYDFYNAETKQLLIHGVSNCKHEREPITDKQGFEVCPDCGKWGEDC